MKSVNLRIKSGIIQTNNEDRNKLTDPCLLNFFKSTSLHTSLL